MTDARILDRGYRAYDGPRRGPSGAVRSVMLYSVRRAIGLRRTVWAKALPIASIALAYVPALAFVGIAALLPDLLEGDLLPQYPDYYGFVTSAIIVFSAFVAPEVLCPDRRNGMLGLYLSAPLTRDTYLLAKAAAVASVLALVTLGPPLLLLIAYTFEGTGPANPGDFLLVLIRIVAAGVAISAAHTTLSLAIASLTDRRAVASAGVILVLLVSAAATGVLVDVADAPEWVLVFNLLVMPFELVQRIYGVELLPEVPTWAVLAANVAWSVVAAGVVRFRYQRLAVRS
jgi:ABC-2 type transport system permease protein